MLVHAGHSDNPPPTDLCERTSSAVASAPAESECQVIPESIPSRTRATVVARPIPESDAVMMAVAGAKPSPPAVLKLLDS